jgi:hypothetical protein
MPMPSYGKDMRVHVKKEVETVCEMQQKINICLGNNTILFLVKLKNRERVIHAKEWQHMYSSPPKNMQKKLGATSKMQL